MMEKEHEEILRFIGELRQKCLRFMEQDEMEPADFYAAIEFIRNYADKRHHQKEEQILFKAMLEHLGPLAEKLITNGMLVEHDLARLYVRDLETALQAYEREPLADHKLDIIANAMGYCYLLERHATKENDVVYPFAARSLPAELWAELDREALAYEKQFA